MKVSDIIKKYETQIVQIAKFWGFSEISICSPIKASTEGHLNLMVFSSQHTQFGNMSLLNEELESVLKCAVTVVDANLVGQYILEHLAIFNLSENGTKDLPEMEDILGTEYFNQELDKCHLYNNRSSEEIAYLQNTFKTLKEARVHQLAELATSSLPHQMQQMSLSSSSLFFPQQQSSEQKEREADISMAEPSVTEQSYSQH